MHIRNLLIRPPFVMFYLTFLVPESKDLLERHGFRVQVVEHAFPPPFKRGYLVVGQLVGYASA